VTLLPIVPSPAPDTFIFHEEKNPLGRVIPDMAPMRPKIAFEASGGFQYDAAQHGPLQTVLESLEPFT
jgi:hypothetical protein